MLCEYVCDCIFFVLWASTYVCPTNLEGYNLFLTSTKLIQPIGLIGTAVSGLRGTQNISQSPDKEHLPDRSTLVSDIHDLRPPVARIMQWVVPYSPWYFGQCTWNYRGRSHMEKTVGIAQRIRTDKKHEELSAKAQPTICGQEATPSFPLVEPDEATDRVALISTESDAGGNCKELCRQGLCRYGWQGEKGALVQFNAVARRPVAEPAQSPSLGGEDLRYWVEQVHQSSIACGHPW
jgi:hypothetical protein